MMEAHFRLLGIPRGCDEETLRKAYRQKARALHPDRNPAGIEQFKLMCAAYEALRAHFSRNGGRDPVPVTTAAGVGPTVGTTFAFNYGGLHSKSGSAFNYARCARNSPGTPRFFTDEELFGGLPGGFTYEKRVPKYGRGAQTGSAGDTSDSGYGWFNKKFGGATSFGNSQLYTQADERWRRAHGDRVPVSGYSTSNGAAPPPPFSFQHQQWQKRQQQQQQQQQEQQKQEQEQEQKQKQTMPQQTTRSPRARQSPPLSSFTADFSSGMRFNQEDNDNKKNTKTGSSSGINQRQQSTNVHSEDNISGRSNSKGGKGYADSDRYSSEKNSKTHWRTSFNYNTFKKNSDEFETMSERTSGVNEMLDELGMQETLNKVRRDWEQINKDMTFNMSNVASGSSRRNGRQSDCKVVDEDDDYVVYSKRGSSSMSGSQQRIFRERQRLNDSHMKSILEEKLKLKKILFTQRYAPDPADVALMSDSEVFILGELLRDMEERMKKVLHGRMTKGLCARCSAAPKLQNNKIFSCGHTSVCEECALSSGVCPVCAASRR